MRPSRTKFAIFLLCFGLACTVPQLLARKKDKDQAASGANQQRRALHALNRLTFGPRPGDVQQVMAMGVDQWIDLQLHPGKIDDSAVASRLEPFRTLRMGTKEIAEDFPDPQELNQIMDGRRSMPSDAARRAVYQVQLARLQDRKDRKKEADKKAASATDKPTGKPAEPSAMAPSTEQAVENANAETPGMNGATSDTMNSSASNDAPANTNPTGDENTMAGSVPPTSPAKMTPEEEELARRREEQLYADLESELCPRVIFDAREQAERITLEDMVTRVLAQDTE